MGRSGQDQPSEALNDTLFAINEGNDETWARQHFAAALKKSGRCIVFNRCFYDLDTAVAYWNWTQTWLRTNPKLLRRPGESEL
jgi:hypothetical protein